MAEWGPPLLDLSVGSSVLSLLKKDLAGSNPRLLRAFVEDPDRSPEFVEGIATRSRRRRFRLATHSLSTLALPRLS